MTCHAQQYEGNVNLRTQAEDNAFAVAGYTSINGNLSIGDWIWDGTDIMTLSQLSSVTSVTG